MDDYLFKKTNDSDCTQYALLYTKTKPHREQLFALHHTLVNSTYPAYPIDWAIIWILLEIGIFIMFILIGLIYFKRSTVEMNHEAGTWHLLNVNLF